jgi:hypothetical protein
MRKLLASLLLLSPLQAFAAADAPNCEFIFTAATDPTSATYPATVASGGQAYIYLWLNSDTGTATAPTGFTEAEYAAGGGEGYSTYLFRQNSLTDGNEDSDTLSIDLSGSITSIAATCVVANAGGHDDSTDTATLFETDTTLDSPSTNTTANDTRVILFGWNNGTQNTATLPTGASNCDGETEINQASNASVFCGTIVDATSGTTGTHQWTGFTAFEQRGAATVTVLSAGGGGASVAPPASQYYRRRRN